MRVFQRSLFLAGALALAACSKPIPPTASMTAAERPRANAAQSDSQSSNLRRADFVRANGDAPGAAASVLYVNEQHCRGYGLGLTSLQIVEGLDMAVVGEAGNELDMTPDQGDEDLKPKICGKLGEHFEIVLRNNTKLAYELVATVDGLDVLSGLPGSHANRGYVIYPGDTLIINGFPKNEHKVAAFHFAAVGASDATNGHPVDAARVGVIGVAVFAQRPVQ